jgi:hypothetical protein
MKESDDHVEDGRLPRAIGPQQTHDFASVDFDADLVHHLPATKRLRKLITSEMGHRIFHQ